jgi:glycosyltransferase involved in cell wall biosynthesis
MRPLRPPRDSLRNLRRIAQELSNRPHADLDPDRPLDFERDRVILLHYEDFERDTLVAGDRHLRRAVRRVYHAVTAGTIVSGFEVAYRMLVKALELAGYRVVTDPQFAERNPKYPVGLCGYTHVLRHWTLPNPVILGPGLYDHPQQAPNLFDDKRIASYLVPCPWMQELFESAYGHPCPIWFGGIDTVSWPDLSANDKDLDFLLYDKIRWNREKWESALLTPVEEMLKARGLSYEIVRYGAYDINDYRAQLKRARAMIFLCEHETQGFAYQEAMSSNVPILAWDQGWWRDPVNMPKGAAPVPASSVPYFAPECGATFLGAEDFDQVLGEFLAARDSYRPRAYVERMLSFSESARRYVDVYREVAARS